MEPFIHPSTTKPKSGLVSNVVSVVKQGGLGKWILLLLFGYIAMGTLNFFNGQTMIAWTLAIGKRDKKAFISNLFIMMALEVITNIIFAIVDIIKANKVNIITKEIVTFNLWSLWCKADLDWLKNKKSKEDQTAFSDGANTIMNVLSKAIGLLKPLFDAITSIAVVINLVGFRGFWSIASTIILLMCGVLLMRYNYINRKSVNKETNPIRSLMVTKANTAFVTMLNGKAKELRDQMIDGETKVNNLTKGLRIKTASGFGFLDVVHSVVLTLVIMYIAEDLTDLILILPIYTQVNMACQRMWWLFHQFSFIVQEASQWAACESFLEEYQSEEPLEKTTLTSQQLEEEFLIKFPDYQSQKEVRLIGESGCGKTTTMYQFVINLYRKYDVAWLFLDQKMQIEQSSKVTLREFLVEFCPKGNHDKLILEYASILKLRIITPEKLDKPFKNPSGGEEKRTMILKALLPILLGSTNLIVLFLDEVTAGLDHDNWLIVRGLIDHLKKEHDIYVMNIDHHDYDAEFVQRIQITVPDEPEKEPKKASGFVTFFTKDFDFKGWVRSFFKKKMEESPLEMV